MPDLADGIYEHRIKQGIIFVVDTSDALSDRIEQINDTINASISLIRERDNAFPDYTYRVGVLSYGGKCCWSPFDKLISPLDCSAVELKAGGKNNIGDALRELDVKMSRKALFKEPPFSTRSIIIIISCSTPETDYQEQLKSVWKNGWFARSTIICIGIGNNVDIHMLAKIAQDSGSIIQMNDFCNLKSVTKMCLDEAMKLQYGRYGTYSSAGAQVVSEIAEKNISFVMQSDILNKDDIVETYFSIQENLWDDDDSWD